MTTLINDWFDQRLDWVLACPGLFLDHDTEMAIHYTVIANHLKQNMAGGPLQ